MACLGDCHLTGEGVEQNYLKAIELFRRAADLGEPNATFNLGMCYLRGLGVREPDRNKAFALFQRAKELGQPLAIKLIDRLKAK